MVISKTKDFRKRKKREIFFGMPFLPLATFLILIITVLVVSSLNETNRPQNEFSSKQQYEIIKTQITGEVVGGLNLTKINYNINEPLQGQFNLKFYQGDLIPVASNLSFKISGIKCNYFYVCGDGETLAPWEFYNVTAGRCQNISGYWQTSPWEDYCGESYNVYPNENSAINCTSLGGKCCDAGNGIGYFYPNLNCSYSGANKECWDDCATTQVVNLKTLVSKSTTPTKGNYSYGTYNNVNGSEPSGQGWGFGYCTETAGGTFGGGIFGRLGNTGYAIGGPGIEIPDLVVSRVYLSEEIENKIYATVENIIGSVTKEFVVVACWGNPPDMNCKDGQVIPPIPPNCIVKIINPINQRWEVNVGNLDLMLNKRLYVEADYCEVINEANESNNVLSRWIGCLDLDGLDPYIFGTCEDMNGKYDDICSLLPGIEGVQEKYCVNALPLPYCSTKTIECGKGEICQEGRCVQQPVQPWCNDTDEGNPMVGGSCLDSQGNSGFDDCINETYLKEYVCAGFNWPQCTYNYINCEEVVGTGSRCVIDMISGFGKCSESVQLKPDLIVEKIERTSDMRKVLVWIKNQGNAIAIAPFNVSLNITGETNAFEILTFNSNLGSGSNGSIIGQTNIEGKTVYVTAFADYPSPGVVDESNEYNNEMANVYLSPYSCQNWSNVYIVPLGSNGLNLKAPADEGNYYLNVSLYYNSNSTGFVEMSKTSAIFIARRPTIYYYKGCENNKCITKKSTTPKNDTCDSDSDCTGPGYCNENWKFKDLTGCVNKQRKLECYDEKNCGTIDKLPLGCNYDAALGRYFKIESCCESNWQCDAWSVCYKHQGSSVQSMTCKDLNECNPQNSSYIQLRDCCIEDWQCKWGPCINGRQKLICQEMAGCGTEFTKPKEEIKECKEAIAIAWWIWLIIIVAVVAVTLVILFATRVIRLPKAKKEFREEIEKAKPEENLELINYIKSALAAGMSKEEIKKKLIEAGWPQDLVDLELKKF
ncbi:MAG: hypothetical protein QW484_02745 [Candidatus Pacearchaeota archaeon]